MGSEDSVTSETPQSARLGGGGTAAAVQGAPRMTHTAYPALAPRRRRWPLLLIVAIVAGLAAAWTALWFYATARAKTEIAAWREREYQAGRFYDCASESIGGYPFRIEWRCASAVLELKGTPPVELKLPVILAAVQIYDPTLVIGEFTGPLDISEPGRPPNYVANWSLGQASVRGTPDSLERTSLVLDVPTVRDPRRAGNDTVFRAQRLELHGRLAPGSTADNPAIDTVLRVNAGVAPYIHAATTKPIDADIAAVLRGLSDVSPKPWPVRFKEWQERGGQIDIIKARLQQEDVIAVGSGTVKLTPGGNLDGNLQVAVVGLEQVLKIFEIDRMLSEGQIGSTLGALDRLIPGLGDIARQNAPGLIAAIGQRTVLEGKPAVAFLLRFIDGVVFLGPIQVGRAPPLF